MNPKTSLRATVAEQTHRVSLLKRPEDSERGWLPSTLDRLVAAGVPPEAVTEAVGRPRGYPLALRVACDG